MRLYLILKFLYRVFKRIQHNIERNCIIHKRSCPDIYCLSQLGHRGFIVSSRYLYVQSNYHRVNLAFVGYPVHSVSLRDKHERRIILDKTLLNARLRASKFV